MNGSNFLNELFSSLPTWKTMIWLSALMIGIYIALRVLANFLKQTQYLRVIRPLLNRILKKILILYEPIALILLFGTFFLINPLYHGGILLVPLIVGFSQVRNYLTGKLVQLDDNINTGTIIQVNEVQGIISREGIWGIHVQTREGIHFISYSQLLASGYTLITNKEIGKFSILNVTPPENSGNRNEIITLMDLLTTTPYVDWNYKPDLSHTDRHSRSIRVRVFLRENSHIEALSRLMEEWGYDCIVMDQNA